MKNLIYTRNWFAKSEPPTMTNLVFSEMANSSSELIVGPIFLTDMKESKQPA